MANELTVTLGTAPTIICAGTPGGVLVLQNSASVSAYLGTDTALTTGNGIQLSAGQTMTVSYRRPVTPDTWYGLVATGSGTIVAVVTV